MRDRCRMDLAGSNDTRGDSFGDGAVNSDRTVRVMKRSQLGCPRVAGGKPMMCVHLLDLTDTPGYSDEALCYTPGAHGPHPGAVL